jgi:K+-sensing histidine kinase KdpD
VPDLLRKKFLGEEESKNRPATRQSSTRGWSSTASNLSHELRTPLTSMKSSLSLVLSGDAGPVGADQSHFLNMVMRNVNRLERLIDDRLGNARSVNNDPAPVVDLAPIIAEVIEMQALAAEQSSVLLTASDIPKELTAQIDPDKLVQILTNVIGNAIKYTPENGSVRVWLERGMPADPGLAGQLAREFNLIWSTFSLTIQDTGVGLSCAACARVFEPWYRASSVVPGTGLGLPITNALVAEYGGHIRLDSALGHGTTVRIDLPQDHQSSLLMRAANSLQALVSDGGAQTLAVLDAREHTGDQEQLFEVLNAFVASHSDHEVVTVVPGLFASVVPTSAAWSRSWEMNWLSLLQEHGCSAGTSWRLLAWHGTPRNQESTMRFNRRTLN